MKRLWCLIILLISPSIVLGAEERGVVVSFILNILPFVIFIVVWIWVMKVSAKSTERVNERIAKSNEEIRDQLERIANALEKDS